jgi:predicted nuclease of predicted toxin-antitoxin system
MLISALLPERENPETQIILLTKDKDFVDAFRNFELETILGH